MNDFDNKYNFNLLDINENNFKIKENSNYNYDVQYNSIKKDLNIIGNNKNNNFVEKVLNNDFKLTDNKILNNNNNIKLEKKYNDFSNKNKFQILYLKAKTFYLLNSLIFYNFYRSEFDELRKGYYIGISIFFVSQIYVNIIYRNHPLKNTFLWVFFILSNGIIYSSYRNNLDFLCSYYYNNIDKQRKDNFEDRELIRKMIDYRNDIALYNPFNKVYNVTK